MIESPGDSESDEDLEETGGKEIDLSNDSSSDEEAVQRNSRDKRQQKKKPPMPLSIMIPKSLWPRG